MKKIELRERYNQEKVCVIGRLAEKRCDYFLNEEHKKNKHGKIV